MAKVQVIWKPVVAQKRNRMVNLGKWLTRSSRRKEIRSETGLQEVQFKVPVFVVTWW